MLEDEKTKLRHRYSDCEDELKMKYGLYFSFQEVLSAVFYNVFPLFSGFVFFSFFSSVFSDELEAQYNELQEKYKQTQTLASNLQTQLAQAQTEAQEWRDEVDKIRASLEEQIALLKSALENSENERKICEDKWQREFEMLRTQNMGEYEGFLMEGH